LTRVEGQYKNKQDRLDLHIKKIIEVTEKKIIEVAEKKRQRRCKFI